jgi:hypothetical protein
MQIRWIAYSRDKQDLVFVHAEDHREAIVKAMDRGIRPSRSSDVRPHDEDAELMGTSEFDEFMS